MLKRLAKILIGVAVVAAVAVLAVQILLTTDIPRRLALDAVRGQTGLRAEAADLQTGWGGSSTLTDVKLWLPLEPEPFLVVPELSLSHAGLLKLAFLRQLDLNRVALERPTIRLRRDEEGRWNIAEAVELIRSRRDDGPASEGVDLPDIVVRNGTVEIMRGGDVAYSTPLAFRGENAGPSLWAFELQLDAGQQASGKLAPGGEWEHDVDVEFARLDRLVAALTGDGDLPPPANVPSLAPSRGVGSQPAPESSAPEPQPVEASPRHTGTDGTPLPPVDARAGWRGRVQDGALAGRLELRSLQAGELNLRGGAAVQIDGGELTLRPRAIWGAGAPLPGEVRLSGGSISYVGGLVRAERATVEALDGSALVTGRWDMNSLEGEADLTIIGQAVAGTVRYEAAARAAIETPFGQPRLRLDVRTDGATPAGRWEADLRATARGTNWGQLEIAIAAPQLTWLDDDGPIDVGGLAARGGWSDGTATLRSLMLPGTAESSIAGRYNSAGGDWSVQAEIREWTAPRAGPVPINLALRAQGTHTSVSVDSIRAERGGLEVFGAGSLLPGREDPVQAQLNVSAATAADGLGDLPLPPGRWSGRFDVAGRVQPLDLYLRGEAEARDVAVARGVIQHALVPIDGHITQELVTVESEPFALLDGEWKIGARVHPQERLLTLRLDTGSLPLQQILNLFEAPVETSGELSAALEATMPGFDPEQLELGGTWNIGATGYRGIAIDRGEGRLSFRRGVVRFEDVVLAQGPGQLTGTLEMNARERRHLLIDLSSRNWPVSIKGTRTGVVLDSRATVDLDIVDLTGTGSIDGRGEVVVGDRQVGRMLVDATINGRTIVASRILGQLPSGRFSGTADVPLDDWLRSTGELTLERVDLSELSAWGGIEDFITGTVSGTIAVGPSGTPRAQEPLRVGVSLDVTGGRFRALTFGDAAITAFIGRDRLVMEQSRLELAQGVAELWARSSRHEAEPFLHTVVSLRGLELNEFVQTANPDAPPVLGRVSGQAAVGGYVRHPHRAFGEGRLFLTDSDLANVPVISLVYGLLNLSEAADVPSGEGLVDLRLEGDTLEITRMQYFNRGADVVGSLEIGNIWLLGRSPVRGTVAGVIRPLKGVDLPLLPDLDRLLSALQSKAVSARIDGTLAERQVRVVPFEEVSGAISRVLGLTPAQE